MYAALVTSIPLASYACEYGISLQLIETRIMRLACCTSHQSVPQMLTLSTGQFALRHSDARTRLHEGLRELIRTLLPICSTFEAS